MGDHNDKDKTGNHGDRPNPGKKPATGGDDSRLWRHVTRNVTPIARNAALPESMEKAGSGTTDTPQPPPSPSPKPRKKMTAMRPPDFNPGLKEATPKPRPRPESGIDKRTLDRLRRGKMPIEAVLDLHGMRQDEAHRRLVTFILSCWMNKTRTLLIITGKGTRSAEPGGVLRKQVPRWLHDAPLGEKVLTIQPAQPKDGGSGAYYVLLRRRRD